MAEMTMGEIAFHEAQNLWNRQSKSERRCAMRLIAEDDIMAECYFGQLPAHVRDSLIKDWERQHLDIRAVPRRLAVEKM